MNVLTILESNVTVVRTCTSTASVTDSLANSLFECLGLEQAGGRLSLLPNWSQRGQIRFRTIHHGIAKKYGERSM